ncbi:MAG: hypothetical protein ACLFV2_05710 [Desulfurivibrionaceae bacterium]
MINKRWKILKVTLLISFLLASSYLLYISSKQDYTRFSPIRWMSRPGEDKPGETRDEDYMDFINKSPIHLPKP